MANTGLPVGGAAGAFPTGSSAFLETTRTNVIVLQDLEGLCWRRYTLAQVGYGLSKNSGQQHALLSAFTRAIEAGYASTVVHRSSKSGTQSPHFGSHVDQQMDLYVFWQQQGGNAKTNHNNHNSMGISNTPQLELPAALSGIMSSVPNCKVAEEGCWDRGMSYAVRCMLMKATNCLVQAQLARGGYHRIGRYFVKTNSSTSDCSISSPLTSTGHTQSPQTSSQQRSNYSVAFTLNYFVHGEGRQLCAFVNARRRPAVARLSAQHLLDGGAENTNVILCPFGLSGLLTGKALNGSEATEFLKLFAHTCPVVPSPSETNGLPSVVEVAIAGGAVRTWYPTHSLLVVDDGKSASVGSTSVNDTSTCQPTATSSPQQRRVPNPRRPNSSACDIHPSGFNALDLMSSNGSEISTHPSVLPSPNCACSLSLTGKRSNNTSSTTGASAPKRHSFHRSCHLKAEEAVPSPLMPMSQGNDEMSVLFPPPSVAGQPGAAADQTQNDQMEWRSTISGPKTQDSVLVNENTNATTAPNEPRTAAVTSSVAKTLTTPSISTTTAAPITGSQISPQPSQEVVPRKAWPSVQDREALQRVATAYQTQQPAKSVGFLFSKQGTHFQNDTSYMLSMAFSKFLSNPKAANEDLVSLFGYDSLSCAAELSPPAPSSKSHHQHSSAAQHGHHHQSHNQQANPALNVHQHNIRQQQASSLAVLLDSPDMSEPLSVERNHPGSQATLDMIATLGQSNNRVGAELPDNFLDVDSDASDGQDNSPTLLSQGVAGSTAPNSLDAHFPTPPTSVETNAPPSLRGITPAAATTSNVLETVSTDPQVAVQQLAGIPSVSSRAALLKSQGLEIDDPFSVCETVFHPDTSCAFVEGERYRPLNQVSTQTAQADDLITIGNSSTTISMKSLRHEPSKNATSISGTPMKQLQPTANTYQPRDQPMSPLSFLNSLGAGGNVTTAGNEIFSKSPDLFSQHLPKNFEQLVPDSLVTLLLHMSDSVLDLHRDVNFDMAPLCACSNSPLRGVDWPAYFRTNAENEDGSMSTDGYGNGAGGDAPWPGTIAECSCGYSAVFNRRFASYGCGMLRDDERELLTSNASLKAIMKFSRPDSSAKLEPALIRLCQKLCSVASPPVPFVAHIARAQLNSAPWTGSKSTPNGFLKRMAIADKNSSLPMCRCRTCFAESLESNSIFVSALVGFLETEVMEDVSDEDCFFFHNWINSGNCLSAESSLSTGELFRVVSNIHPLLMPALRPQEAQPAPSKHQRETLNNGDSKGISATVANAGPLQLISLFESGADTVATAVPIPYVMASCEKEAIQLAPSSLGPCWERNGLEPVAGAGRRLCYFSVRPSVLSSDSNFDDEEQIETMALKYFINEVGRVMVDCRLASVHTPLVEASFPMMNNHHQPHNQSQQQQKVPRMPIVVESLIDNSPATPNRSAQNASAQRDWLRTVQKMIVDSLADRDQVDSSYDGCVCYVVVRDQTVASQVMRLFAQLLDQLPSDDYRERVCLQMVPSSFAALAWSGSQSAIQAEVRRLAFSIYTQLGSRWRLDRGERALTDTGPLPIMREVILTEARLALAAQPDRKPIKYSPENATGLWEGPLRWPNSPIAVLARLKDQQTRLAECCGQKADSTVVVFAAYCPTPDNRFLLVSLSDDCGYIVKTGVLALETPVDQADQQPPSGDKNRSRHSAKTNRMRPPVARAAVERVWCWLLGAISHSSLAVPVRLVLTRLGRLGHGEVRTWSALLSRQSLLQMSSKLQGACNHCQALPSPEVPCVISSCLISLEPHPWLRLMASNSSTAVATSIMQGAGLSSDLAAAGEFRSAGKLFTCTGSSAYSSTHVFAFPTSATIQAQTQAVADEVQDSDQWDLLFPVDIDKDILDIPAVSSPSAGGGLMGFDELGGFGGLSASGSHQPSSRQNSVAGGGGWPRQSMGDSGATHNIYGSSQNNFFGVDSTAACTGAPSGGGSAGCSLLQQPLAVAFVVSTAPMGPTLPEWLNTIVRNAGTVDDSSTDKPFNTTHVERPSSLRAALLVHTASILPTAISGAGGLNAGGLGGTGSSAAGGAATGAGGAGGANANMTLQEHPLDSRRTVDVLRYAVEEHDALSWLAVDPATGQRMSCLPPHIVALVNLHQMLFVFSR